MIRLARTRTLALCSILTLSAGACSSPSPELKPSNKTEAPAKPAEDAKPAEAPEPAKDSEPVAPPAAALAPAPIVYYVGSQLWRVEADGTNARALGLEVSGEDDGSGTVGHGESTPTISRDGRWLAYVQGTDLWIAEFASAGPQTHQITKMPPSKDEWIVAAELAFSEWSPDSTTLVVALDEPSYEEESPLPMPAGLEYGFAVLQTSDLALTHAAHIQGYYGWMPDSKGVLDSAHVSQANYELRAYSIEPGPAKVLRTSTEGYGFAQMHVAGDFMAWNSSGEDLQASVSQILVAPIAGGEPKPLSPRAGFAAIQRPVLAPDGARAVFKWKGGQVLGSSADEAAAKQLPEGTWRWLDADHLVGVTSEGLVVMDLDANIRALDRAATALVRL
ncbi:hypothetical protein DB30_07484 [Enhygromyxa salina]|uniref:Dipeptidylpeptidase IV N-terminal domain-containing protein n=1 Tax=Enhygromyxa salina TaxID=215803 RepID=A0A0C2CRR3_9BACT|nr:DPP IV N-terminal domain-containing protein [Enhygromyxa salina]KIG13881.1 hypothetical protein DB30_07484 [Enhygromyxa salina]